MMTLGVARRQASTESRKGDTEGGYGSAGYATPELGIWTWGLEKSEADVHDSCFNQQFYCAFASFSFLHSLATFLF